ncbi:MAG: ABC transporter substrate-binding protein [Eubacteriales bacterium]
MKKLNWLALLLALLMAAAVLAGCGQKEQPKKEDQAAGQKSYMDTIKARGFLIAGVKNDVPLFGQLKPGATEPEGFEVDLMKELAVKIFGDPSKIKLEKVESKTRIPMVQNGQVDIVAGTTTVTDERKQQVDFSDVYFKAGQSLLVKKDGPIKSIEDLKGKKVSTAQGSTSVKNIRAKAPDAEILEFTTYTECFLALEQGRVDAMTTDNSILLGFAKDDPNYVLTGGLFSDEPYGLVMQKGHPEWVQFVNDWLKEIQKNGKFAEIYKKWFGEAPPA